MPDRELPWAGPPKSHLRWPSLLFGVFGISVGLLIVGIGVFAIIDYSSTNTKVEFDPPDTAHPEILTRASADYIHAKRSLDEHGNVPTEPTHSSPSPVEPLSSSTAETSTSATDEARAHAKSKQRTFVARAGEVKRYLATFLAKSYFQPTGNYLSVKYERTTEELPVSFTRIESSGALDPSVQGLRTLVILASSGFSPPNNWHGRPPWNFDIGTFSWSKSDQDFIQKAQDLLRELGPTLAELKMLAP